MHRTINRNEVGKGETCAISSDCRWCTPSAATPRNLALGAQLEASTWECSRGESLLQLLQVLIAVGQTSEASWQEGGRYCCGLREERSRRSGLCCLGLARVGVGGGLESLKVLNSLQRLLNLHLLQRLERLEGLDGLSGLGRGGGRKSGA